MSLLIYVNAKLERFYRIFAEMQGDIHTCIDNKTIA